MTLQVTSMFPKWRVQMTEAMGSLNKYNPCVVCCGKVKSMKILHKHLSTAHYNSMMAKRGESSPMCYFCDMHHPIDHMSRGKVILSSSTLHAIQFMEGWGWDNEQPTHVDMETIPGAQISTLRKAWERAYGRNPLPIDTILVAGLNDVKYFCELQMRQGVPLDQLPEPVSSAILTNIKILHNTINEHSQSYSVDDTLSVATILHTPSMYWHDIDGEVPSPDYVNFKDVIDRTNLKIEEYNLLHGVSTSPKLHETGERGRGKGNKRGYQFSAWREEFKEDMLHLTDPIRMRMTMSIVKFFRKATPEGLPIS